MSFIERSINSSRLFLYLSIFVFSVFLLASLVAQVWFISNFFTQSGASNGLMIRDSIVFDSLARGQVLL